MALLEIENRDGEAWIKLSSMTAWLTDFAVRLEQAEIEATQVWKLVQTSLLLDLERTVP